MEKVSKYLIYGLFDPDTQELRYVGKSCSGLRRPREHWSIGCLKKNSHCQSWIKNVISRGKLPEIEILEQHSKKEDLKDAEIFWIAYFRFVGCRLTNMTDGGEGVTNPSLETRERMRRAKLGKHLSVEHKEAISRAHRGKSKGPLSLEHRANIGKAHLGMKASEETRKRMSESGKGVPQPADFGSKISKVLGHPVIRLNDNKEFNSMNSAAIDSGISLSSVQKILKGKRNSIKGFSFKMKNGS